MSGSLDLIPDMHLEREKIVTLSQTLRALLKGTDWEIENGNSHIFLAVCSTAEICQKLSDHLTQKNILTTPLLPPAVPQGVIRLRFMVNALHTTDDLKILVNA